MLGCGILTWALCVVSYITIAFDLAMQNVHTSHRTEYDRPYK